MYERCPKCGHRPLPADQSLPAACPACGVILAKIGSAPPRRAAPLPLAASDDDDGLRALLWRVPDEVDPTAWRVRVALLLAFAAWGLRLALLDYRDGEIFASFVHGPLLVFHEAGHVIFRPLGEWMTVLGGTLGQLLMPAILGGALLWKNRDPFGAAIGLWFVGVSVLDVAPYMYDALQPQLVLLNGSTGEEGGHDWIYLFDSMNLLARAQRIGAATHAAGVAIVALAVAWGAGVLARQRRHVTGDASIGP
ncbi:MAG TPA: hypothetical protein VIP05_29905 [Burkholderiaceae bacterium]